ncbi:MAG: hypothetical protein ACJAYX_003335 [Planctomycetota bacterium]|jgi:hypothetical protein
MTEQRPISGTAAVRMGWLLVVVPLLCAAFIVGRRTFPGWAIWDWWVWLGSYSRWRRVGLNYQWWQLIAFGVMTMLMGWRFISIGRKIRLAERRAESESDPG